MPMPAATNAGSIEGIEGESPAARFVARKPIVNMIAPPVMMPRKPFLSANLPAGCAIKIMLPGMTVSKSPVFMGLKPQTSIA